MKAERRQRECLPKVYPFRCSKLNTRLIMVMLRLRMVRVNDSHVLVFKVSNHNLIGLIENNVNE